MVNNTQSSGSVVRRPRLPPTPPASPVLGNRARYAYDLSDAIERGWWVEWIPVEGWLDPSSPLPPSPLLPPPPSPSPVSHTKTGYGEDLMGAGFIEEERHWVERILVDGWLDSSTPLPPSPPDSGSKKNPKLRQVEDLPTANCREEEQHWVYSIPVEGWLDPSSPAPPPPSPPPSPASGSKTQSKLRRGENLPAANFEEEDYWVYSIPVEGWLASS